MKTTLLLLTFSALAHTAVIQQHVRKSESLRAKLIKEGKFEEFVAQQYLARANSVSNVAVVSQPLMDSWDEFYLGDIALGTPYQHFSVMLDTGSANLWVIDAACTTQACKGYPGYSNKHQFNTEKSSTFVKTSEPFQIVYGSGNCSGYIATDVLNLAGLVYRSQGIGIATAIAEVFGQQPIDGILGLGWPALAQNHVMPPMQNLLNQLDQPIFTVWLDRHVAPVIDKPGGLITYGGLDGKNCDSQIDYVTLSSKTYWQFPMAGFSIGSYSSNTKQEVISDTGTAWIGAPSSAVTGIIKATGAQFDWAYQMYTLPCKGSYPDMVFTIGGKKYTVPANEYVIDISLGGGKCALTLFEMSGGGFGPTWILGDTFIRTYCNIHDIGRGRIGFAKARHSEV